ncbi:MAG TPA: DUF1707 domain-containing protein [Acidimicrobiales bacterium]|nr:DUF1707 domain-containing protein [Acidimicrobiales bacterium]
MRVSDTERQRAVDELRRHCVAGRIDMEEYAARVEQALTATTLEELDRLRADLPMLRVAEPAGGRGIWARPRPQKSGERARGPAAAVSVLLLVVAVLAAVVLAVAASWTWAALLALGWLAGAAFSRARGAARR